MAEVPKKLTPKPNAAAAPGAKPAAPKSPSTKLPNEGEKKSGTPKEKAPASLTAKAGMVMGDFRLVKPLGKGGMAEVWLAEQISLKRQVAVKMMRPDLLDNELSVKRFEVEAMAAANLNHPNIVQVYTVGQHEGWHYLVQEYVEGQTLLEVIKKKGMLEVPAALHVMRQVATALQAAADREIVHRDIKPENIMLNRKGEVKVADFGLAQLSIQGEKLHITQEGMTMGTPHYMSPEQVQGQKLDPRSDIYSFGVTCYHMLCGKTPFRGDTAVSVAVQHINAAPPSLATMREGLPKGVVALVHKMMEKDPAKRFPDARLVLAEVRRLQKALKTGDDKDSLAIAPSGPRWFQRTGWAATVLVLLVGSASAGLGWGLHPGDPFLQPVPALKTVSKVNSAEDQYLNAVFQVDNEEAWLAVRRHWTTESLWVNRATEQLALLYLKQKDRWSDAEKLMQELQSLRTESQHYYEEGRCGEAALKAYKGDPAGSKTILAAEREKFDQHLRGTWRTLWRETDLLVNPKAAESGG